jgi:hypothetical protein
VTISVVSVWVVVIGCLLVMIWFDRVSRRLNQKIGERLQQRAEAEIEMIGHVRNVIADLIRVEPEREETLTIADLELKRLRLELEDDVTLFAALTTGRLRDMVRAGRSIIANRRDRRD